MARDLIARSPAVSVACRSRSQSPLVPVRRWPVFVFAGLDEAVFEFLLDTFAGFAATERLLTRLLVYASVLVFPGTALAPLFNSVPFSVSFVVLLPWRRPLPLRARSGGCC